MHDVTLQQEWALMTDEQKQPYLGQSCLIEEQLEYAPIPAERTPFGLGDAESPVRIVLASSVAECS